MTGEPSIKRYDSEEFTQVDIDSPRNTNSRSRWSTWSGSSQGNAASRCGGLFGANNRWFGGETWTDVATSFLFPIWSIITWRVLVAIYLSITSVLAIISKALDTHPLSTNIYLLQTLSALLLLTPYFIRTRPPSRDPPHAVHGDNLPPSPSTPLTSSLYTMTTIAFQATTTLSLTHTIMSYLLTSPHKEQPSSTAISPTALTLILVTLSPLPTLFDTFFSNLPQNLIYHILPLTYLILYLIPQIVHPPEESAPLYKLLYNPKGPLPKNNPGLIVALYILMYIAIASILYLLYRLRVSCFVENTEAIEYSLDEKKNRGDKRHVGESDGGKLKRDHVTV